LILAVAPELPKRWRRTCELQPQESVYLDRSQGQGAILHGHAPLVVGGGLFKAEEQ
jgi:hypothetical protein